MKSRKYKVLPIILILSNALTPTWSSASESVPPTTNAESIQLTPPEVQATIDMLRACDKALGAEKSYSGSLEHIQSKQNELLDTQSGRIEQLESKQSGLIQSPTFWFIAGMIVTGVTVKLVK